MKILLLLSILLVSSCAPVYKLVRYERTGPVNAEIWEKPDGTCERRVYLDSMYFVTKVDCPK